MSISNNTRPPGATSRRIATMRADRGLTLRAAGAAWGINPTQLSRMESHEPPPNHPTLVRLAQNVGVPLDELTHGTTVAPLNDRELMFAERGQKVGKSGAGGKAYARKTARKQAAHTAAGEPTVTRRPRGMKNHSQALRTMITTINVARMQGQKVVPVPIDELTAFVSLILASNGTKPETLLLQSDFNEVFG